MRIRMPSRMRSRIQSRSRIRSRIDVCGRKCSRAPSASERRSQAWRRVRRARSLVPKAGGSSVACPISAPKLRETPLEPTLDPRESTGDWRPPSADPKGWPRGRQLSSAADSPATPVRELGRLRAAKPLRRLRSAPRERKRGLERAASNSSGPKAISGRRVSPTVMLGRPRFSSAKLVKF